MSLDPVTVAAFVDELEKISGWKEWRQAYQASAAISRARGLVRENYSKVRKLVGPSYDKLWSTLREQATKSPEQAGAVVGGLTAGLHGFGRGVTDNSPTPKRDFEDGGPPGIGTRLKRGVVRGAKQIVPGAIVGGVSAHVAKKMGWI